AARAATGPDAPKHGPEPRGGEPAATRLREGPGRTPREAEALAPAFQRGGRGGKRRGRGDFMHCFRALFIRSPRPPRLEWLSPSAWPSLSFAASADSLRTLRASVEQARAPRAWPGCGRVSSAAPTTRVRLPAFRAGSC